MYSLWRQMQKKPIKFVNYRNNNKNYQLNQRLFFWESWNKITHCEISKFFPDMYDIWSCIYKTVLSKLNRSLNIVESASTLAHKHFVLVMLAEQVSRPLFWTRVTINDCPERNSHFSVHFIHSLHLSMYLSF